MQETKRRLFIAIHLPKEILRQLEEVQQSFKRFASDAKWVNVQSIHLTLRFLGYVDPSIIPSIQESMLNLSPRFAPMSVTLKGCDFFPNSRKPTVFWTGVDSKDLLPIQKQIEDAIQTLGMEKEERTFNPHLTLARFRNSYGLTPLVEEARKFQNQIWGTFVAESFVLFESILHREGAEYIRIQEFPFKL